MPFVFDGFGCDAPTLDGFEERCVWLVGVGAEEGGELLRQRDCAAAVHLAAEAEEVAVSLDVSRGDAKRFAAAEAKSAREKEERSHPRLCGAEHGVEFGFGGREGARLAARDPGQLVLEVGAVEPVGELADEQQDRAIGGGRARGVFVLPGDDRVG